MLDASERLRNLSPRGWTLLAAIAFGLGGMLAALVTLVGLPVLVPAGIGGLTVGGVLWWFAVESRRSASPDTGVNVGTLTGLLSHVVMWFVDGLMRLVELGASYTFLETVRYLAIHVWLASWASILITGIITVAVGGFIGWKLVGLRRPSMKSSGTTGQA